MSKWYAPNPKCPRCGGWVEWVAYKWGNEGTCLMCGRVQRPGYTPPAVTTEREHSVNYRHWERKDR